MYIKKTIEKTPNRFVKAIVEVPQEAPSTEKKDFIRYDIEKEVFDLPDSVADNSKMISLTLSLVSRIYDTLSKSAKDKIPAKDRAMIEGLLDLFKETTTLADEQFAKEGPEMVNKILDRQAKVAKIVKKHQEQGK